MNLDNTTWPTRPLGTVSEILTGLPLSRRASEDGRPYRVVNIRDLGDTGLLSGLSGLDEVRLPGATRLVRYKVRKGDVLITCRGTSFRSVMVGAGAAGAIASANLLILRPRGDLLAPVLVAWLHTPRGEHEVLSRSRSSAMTLALGREDVAGIPVPVPPLEVQHQIVAVIEATDASYQAAIEAAELRRQVGLEVAARLLTGFEQSEGDDDE